MPLRGLLCGLIAALVATGCGGGEQKAAHGGLPQRLDAELAKRAGELDVPGAAAALLRRGELVWSGAWGKADIEADRPMTAQTPVAYASVGKMITAALALRLAEQGRLSLDDPVRKWVPEWPGKHSKTIRDLLGHNGGIEDAPESFYMAQFRRPARRFRPSDWMAAIRPPAPEDGSIYNNSGFVAAGMALRRAAGGEWLALLRDTAPGIALQPEQRVKGEPARGYVYPEGGAPAGRSRSATTGRSCRRRRWRRPRGRQAATPARPRRWPAGPTACSRAT